MSAKLPWRVEQACFNAFPSLKQVLYGDWLMRLSPAGRHGAVSRRANSVNPLRADCPDVPAVLVAAEALYRANGLPTIFRVPSIVDPALDRTLAARGYNSEGETCVLYGEIGALAAAVDAEVRLLGSPETEWSNAMATLQGFSPAQATTYRRIVRAIAIPARFAMLAVDGAPAALAYGAVHDGLLCYESVITDPHRRRQGLARRVIGALAAWAHTDGAAAACLQVQADNVPALALYAGFGLRTDLYRYHYRREPSVT